MRDIEYKSDRYISKRKGEQFRRIKSKTLFELLNREINPESIYQMVKDCVTDTESQADDISVYSVQSIKSSTNSETSKIESVHGKEEFLGINEESVFLLIDARPEEEYA